MVILRSFGNIPSYHTQKAIAQGNMEAARATYQASERNAFKRSLGLTILLSAVLFLVIGLLFSGCSSPDPAVAMSVERLAADLPIMRRVSVPRNPANQVAYDAAWDATLANVAALNSVVH